MNFRVHASLHSNCHHQVIYAKFDLKIFYSTPCERTVCHFSRANSDHIKKAISLFDWEFSLNNIDINEQVSIFNKRIMNIMSNCVPNELITCDDRDPPWMNRYIKISLLQKVIFIKDFDLPFSNIKMFKNINMFKN